MATFKQMQDRVYSVLRDTTQSFVLLADVKAWLNEGYLDLVARLGLNTKQATDTFDSAGKDTLPADFIELLTLWITSTGEQVEFTSHDIFLSWQLGDETPAHTLARILAGKIETYPAAASLGYTLEYVAAPAELSADGDIPVIPAELHVRIINYARAHAKYMEGEIVDGNLYLALYAEGLPRPPLGVKRERPGHFGLVPAAGPFDE